MSTACLAVEVPVIETERLILREPRLSQPMLFLAPLLLLCIELWVGSRLGQLWNKSNVAR